MKKRKLKPWVGTTISFIIGVIVVANIFSAFNTYASGDSAEEMQSVYGIISMNLNGEAHVRTIDGAYDIEVKLPLRKEYTPMEMVKVSLLGNEVIGHALANEGEEAAVIEAEGDLVQSIREGVFQATFE